MPGVHEQHVVAARFRLASVKEPERAGQRDGIKEVRSHRHNYVHGTGLYELLANFQFRAACVGGGVGHHEPSPALGAERVKESLHPEVVRIIGAGPAQAEPRVVLYLLLVHTTDIEWRIGHDEVELA